MSACKPPTDVPPPWGPAPPPSSALATQIAHLQVLQAWRRHLARLSARAPHLARLADRCARDVADLHKRTRSTYPDDNVSAALLPAIVVTHTRAAVALLPPPPGSRDPKESKVTQLRLLRRWLVWLRTDERLQALREGEEDEGALRSAANQLQFAISSLGSKWGMGIATDGEVVVFPPREQGGVREMLKAGVRDVVRFSRR